MSKNIFSSKRRKSKRKDFFKIGLGVLVILALLLGGIKIISIMGSRPFKGEVPKKDIPKKEVLEVKPDKDDIVPGMNVTYEGEKYAIDAKDVQEMADGTYKGDGKYVFLTFDDGPSNGTEEILKILKDKQVKATFFVLGSSIEKDPKRQEFLKDEIKNGNAIANHSYSHNFKTLYPHNKLNIDVFMDEFNRTNDIMKNVLGEEFNCRVLRMPGGYGSRKYYKDPSLQEFDKILEENGIVNVDWNALNGDAEGRKYSTEEMMNYIKKTSNGKNHVVVLMHDTAGKENTIKILPEVIDYFKSEGYEFKTIKNSSKVGDFKEKAETSNKTK
ncbi:polysaccharide deacetylase family protein [Clostridium sp.]|uniref:polysaccharide deacetylase family protein n=1 Tax=Clostridium sp. TaxID=1506 RepID=UPI00260917E8|nr:polysaccharide deacetylase family protein [Clostridium sp.]